MRKTKLSVEGVVGQTEETKVKIVKCQNRSSSAGRGHGRRESVPGNRGGSARGETGRQVAGPGYWPK